MLERIALIKNYGLQRTFAYGIKEAERFFFWRLMKSSYSLEGEDLIIEHLCGGTKNNGFYVDVGACDPVRFSNTYRFYNKGWSGINIDANPLNMPKFNEARKRDMNVNVGVHSNFGFLDFYVMYPPTVSTFSKDLMESNVASGCRLVNTIKVQVKPLHNILEEYLPKSQEIDFLSIDAEGLDLEVIKSNDWSRFRPNVICVEAPTPYHASVVSAKTFDIYSELHKWGYELAYHNGMDAFFKKSNRNLQ